MKLNFKRYGNGNPILILHGLFGSSDNWRSLGNKLSQNNSVFLIDLRNHGKSPHSNHMNYELMADDIFELIQNEKIKSPVILGHSMGGKVAIMFEKRYPNFFSLINLICI